MRSFLYGGTLTLMTVLHGCSSGPDYQLIPRTEHYTSINGLCKVRYNYPMLIQAQGDSVPLALTGIKEISDFERFIQRFSDGDSAISVEVTYQFFLQEDTLLTLEYLTGIEDRPLKIYHSLTLDPRTFKEYSLGDFFQGDYMSVIRKHVIEFTKQNKLQLNMQPYEREDSGYRINFTLDEDHLILYTGAEGNYHGHYRLLLPLSDFDRKS